MTSVNEKPIKKVRHGFTRITGTSLPLTSASKQPSQPPPASPINKKTSTTAPKATTTSTTNRTSTTTKAAVTTTTTTKAVTTKSKSKASDNNTEDPHDAAIAALKAKELRKRVVEAHLLVGNKQLTPSASSASASNMAKAQRRSSNTLLSGPRMVTSFHDFVKGGPLPTRLNNLKLCKSKTSTVETGTSEHQDSGGSDPEEEDEEETTSMAQLPTTFNNNIMYSQQQRNNKKKSCCSSDVPPQGNTNVQLQQTQIRAQQQQLLLSPQEHQELLESGLLAATDLPPVVFDNTTSNSFIPNEQDVIVGVEVIAEDFRVNYDFQLLVQNNAVAFRDALRDNTPQRKNNTIRNIVKNILRQITVRGGRFVTPTKTNNITSTSTNHREDQQEQGPPPRWVEVNRNIAERFTLHELHNYCVHKLPIREAVLAHAASSVQAQSVAKEYHDTIASLLLKTAVQNHNTTATTAVNGHTTTSTTTGGGVSSSQNNNIKVILPTQFARRVSPPDLHVSSPSTYYESDEQNSNNDTTSSSSPKQQSQESKSSSPSSPTIALDLLSIVAAEMATIEDEIKPPATKKVRIH